MASEQHLLSLKVMRLSRPGFAGRAPLFTDGATDLPAGEATKELLAGDVAAELAEPDDLTLAGMGSFLTLPPAFGNIYLGETFSSYLCVNNESATPVLDLAFKAELQTTSQRFTLADTLSTPPSATSSVGPSASPSVVGLPRTGSTAAVGSAGAAAAAAAASALTGGAGGRTRTSLAGSLLPQQSAEFVIHHDIKELGIHILVCSVHYTPAPSAGESLAAADRERKFFRKFYKFQVLNPLSVKTKVNTLQDGRVFLEAQVQNVSSAPMFLERMSFEPSDHFTYVDLNHRDAQPAGGDGGSGSGGVGSGAVSVFGPREILGQQDTRQYLFMLVPKSATDMASRMTPGLGKLDISWRTQFGQSGRLQTSQLSRKAPTVDPFEVKVISQPEAIFVEQPFTLRVRISNHTPGERLRLSIRGLKNKMTNVLLRGANDIDLGGLEGASHVEVDLEFFSLVAGLQKITGIQISEKISGTTRDIDSLAVVRVLS